MAVVMIGVDPHKASHTAVAIGAAEEPLGQLRVRASAVQAERLLGWAQAWPERAWAVEGAGGLGHLLAQQLLSAGERVLDVPPKLAARVRLLATGNVNKNDPGDARSVAVAALRSAQVREARRDDHATVLKVWSKRYRDLGRARTQVACRLHQVLCELVPGGVPGEITAGRAGQVLASITPAGAVQAARCELAAELTEDLRGVDIRIRETRKKLTEAVRAAGTCLTGLFGVGRSSPPRSSATSATCPALRAGITSPPITAPRRSRYPPAAGRSTGCPGAATAGSATRSIWPRSPRSATGTPRAAPTTTRNWPRAKPRKKRCARSNARSATPSSPACRKTPGAPQPPRQEPGRATGEPLCNQGGRLTPRPPALRASHSRACHPPYDPTAPFPAPLPSRASERPGPGPGAARPRSGARRASSTRPPASR